MVLITCFHQGVNIHTTNSAQHTWYSLHVFTRDSITIQQTPFKTVLYPHGTHYMFLPGSQYPYYKHHPRQCTRYMVLITCFHQGVNIHTTNTIQDSTLDTWYSLHVFIRESISILQTPSKTVHETHGTNNMFSPGSQYPYNKHHSRQYSRHMVLITCFHQGFNNHTTNTILDSTPSTWYSLRVFIRESISILQTPSKTVHKTHGTNYMFSPGIQYPYNKHHSRQYSIHMVLITCFHQGVNIHTTNTIQDSARDTWY